jgi:hypothetical protein
VTDHAELRAALLELHKTLLEVERRDYEKAHGRLTPQQFLDALLHNPTFAWLQPLTTLMVALDEGDDASLTQLRGLFDASEQPDAFQQRYVPALHRSPDLAYAHGVLMRALRA